MSKRIVFSTLCECERNLFVEGFQDADDIGVDDWDCSTPWGCPWLWDMAMWVTDPRAGAYEWGREWFRQNRQNILELKAEEAEVSEKYPGLI